jgi:hypothetical protein
LKSGGHGDHWGCIFRSVEESELMRFIADSINNAEQPELFGGPGVGMAARSPGDRVRACILAVDERLVSAYPEAQGGAVWPIVVQEIVPWANGVEGQITGECHGAAVSFFDTRFYANGRAYKVGETYNFHMNAFAYILRPAEDIEVEAENLGTKVSFRGARAYMPAGMDSEEADIDDFWFHSPLEGEITQTELAGRRLRAYPVTLALPDDFDMSLSLYAADHALSPGAEAAGLDEDLDGFLWLQGYLADVKRETRTTDN